MKEIAYSKTGLRRVVKVYDWYEVQELVNGSWERLRKGYNLQRVLLLLEAPTARKHRND